MFVKLKIPINSAQERPKPGNGRFFIARKISTRLVVLDGRRAQKDSQCPKPRWAPPEETGRADFSAQARNRHSWIEKHRLAIGTHQVGYNMRKVQAIIRLLFLLQSRRLLSQMQVQGLPEVPGFSTELDHQMAMHPLSQIQVNKL